MQNQNASERLGDLKKLVIKEIICAIIGLAIGIWLGILVGGIIILTIIYAIFFGSFGFLFADYKFVKKFIKKSKFNKGITIFALIIAAPFIMIKNIQKNITEYKEIKEEI